jgi:hypothetical protein
VAPRHEGFDLSSPRVQETGSTSHRAALSQARCHPGAIAYLDRRAELGATRKEAIRSLKRRLSDVIYRAMLTDAEHNHPTTLAAA